MIYFVQSVDGGPVKVGTTRNLDRRLKELEARYRRPLSVLATMPGGRKEELQIHRQFSRLRLGNTEQFRPDADLMEFISRPLLVGANPQAVAAMPFPRPDGKTVGIRATGEWAAWIERGARHCRTDVAKLVDVAVAKYLRENGFQEPPPERIP